MATLIKDANAAIDNVIQKSREHIRQLSTNYKEFLDEHEDTCILQSASHTLAKYVKPGESMTESHATKDRVPLLYPTPARSGVTHFYFSADVS